jgi:tetratricopeptide (TPR) repeat protein
VAAVVRLGYELAGHLGAAGDYPAATRYGERVVAYWHARGDKDNPHYATSLNNLGTLYRETGDFTAAEPLLKEALAIRERVLGRDHG